MDNVIKTIAKEFPYMKFELECNFNDIDDDDSYTYDVVTEYIATHLPQSVLDNITYGQAYNDSSVNMEYTFTIKTEAIRDVPQIIEVFRDCAEYGYNTDNAGFHISVLKNKDGIYPSDDILQQDKIDNFAKEVTRLLPALLYAGSNDGYTRSFTYRYPKISRDKYSAIRYGNGCIEYRLFDPCIDNPDKVFEYITTIANTLKYYSKRKLKSNLYNEFKLNTGSFDNSQNKIEKLFASYDNLVALKKTMPYVNQDLSVNMSFKDKKINKIKYAEQIKAIKQYQDYLEQRQLALQSSIERDFKMYIKAKQQMLLLKDLDKITARQYIDIQNDKAYIPESIRCTSSENEPSDKIDVNKIYETLKKWHSNYYTNRTLADFEQIIKTQNAGCVINGK